MAKGDYWIRYRKAHHSDARVRGAARELRECNALCNAVSNASSNASRNAHVTQVLGGLVRLWALADDHIGENDVLPIGANEINDIVGVANFAQSLPIDWLVIVDAEHVKLPNWQAHNGTSARKRLATATRVARHRAVTPDVTLPVTLVTLSEEKRRDSKKRIRSAVAFDPELVSGLNQNAWRTWVEYRAKLGKALKPASMDAAARQMAKLGAGQESAVEQSIANGYQGLFAPKAASANGHASHNPPSQGNGRERAWAEAKAKGRAVGFRDPWPAETPESYATAVKYFENKPSGVLAALKARHEQNH